MLHTLACQKSGCLYLRTQPNVKLSLEVSTVHRHFIQKRKREKNNALLKVAKHAVSSVVYKPAPLLKSKLSKQLNLTSVSLCVILCFFAEP